ncbi:MAG: mechanosensitive ion channel domain-containing protein [Verrucomicrobiota bacterium]
MKSHLLLLLLLVLPLTGQQPTLTPQDVQNQLTELDNASLDDLIANPIRETLTSSLTSLQSADDLNTRAQQLQESLSSAPLETEKLQTTLNTLTPTPVTPDRFTSSQEIRKELEATQARITQLQSQLSEAENQLSTVRNRPALIGSRLPEAESELLATSSKLEALDPNDDSLPKTADRFALLASLQNLTAEIEKLTQERASQEPREKLYLARRDLAARQLELAQTELTALQTLLNNQTTRESASFASRLAQLTPPSGSLPQPEQNELLTQVQTLAQNLPQLAKRLEETSTAHRSLTEKKTTLEQEFDRLKQQSRLSPSDHSTNQLLFDFRRRLPNPRTLQVDIKEREKKIRQLRLKNFEIENQLANQPALRSQLQQNHPHPSLNPLLDLHSELLDRSQTNTTSLIRTISAYDSDQRSYLTLITTIDSFLAEKLFWQRSSAPVDLSFFRDLPAALAWTFDSVHLRELASSLRTLPSRAPAVTLFILLALTALILGRKKLLAALHATGPLTRRISSDHYGHTLRALLYSILLALPVPLILGFLAWSFFNDPSASTWLRGLATGLTWATIFLSWLSLLREVARPNGLAESHFQWSHHTTTTIFRTCLLLALLYVPATLLASITLFEQSSRHFDSVGRLGFVLAHLSLAFVFARAFHPSKGIFADLNQRSPHRLLVKLRHLWYLLAFGIPLTLVLLALIGYYFTALSLGEQLQRTLQIIAAGFLLYGLLLRWFMMKQRKIALKEALENRELRRQAEKEPADESNVTEDEDLELDLDEVATQTRRLLRSLVGVTVLFALWWSWSNTLPNNQNDLALPTSGPLWLGILQALVLLTISFTIIKNLPGLLDLLGLRNASFEPGTRYAIATIAQYALGALTLLLVFKLLNLDWSQFGWMAAALSVGLGFGLQEIVANFVCGIILLFERPIRVGDVVSLGNTTGTVTRIRMRATTITNWDRQEFIVPNKEFITGSIINWTLTNQVNRIVIPVGVAYGSDTKQARELLLKVANQHPLILKDPAPLASFEEFADSTLNLILRCYLPNMDNRLSTITELHDCIDEEFKAANIEIAFPQQDLHLRSMPPTEIPPPAN